MSCIVSDGVMSFTLDAADELGIPDVLFWTTSACGFLAYVHYSTLREKGFIPLKGYASYEFTSLIPLSQILSILLVHLGSLLLVFKISFINMQILPT